MPLGLLEDDFWGEVERVCDEVTAIDSQLPTLQSQSSGGLDNVSDAGVRYELALERVVQTASSVFAPGGEAHRNSVALAEADIQLEPIENILESLVSSLEEPVALLKRNSESVSVAHEQIANLALICDHISAYSTEVNLAAELKRIIEEGDPYSDDFRECLRSLSNTLPGVDISISDNAASLQQLTPLALVRIEERLRRSIEELHVPSTTCEIIRDVFRNKKYLVDFARDHDHNVVSRLLHLYASTASVLLMRTISSYCHLFSKRKEEELGSSSGFDFLRMAGGSTAFLTTVLSETLGTSPVPLDDFEQSSPHRESTDVNVGKSHSQHSDASEKGVEDLDRCLSILQRIGNNPSSRLEISLPARSGLPFEKIFQLCTSYFLHLVSTERAFLDEVFRYDSPVLLSLVFQSTSVPVLELMAVEMDSEAGGTADTTSVLISLLIGRRYRTFFSRPGVIDAGMAFLVEVERVLQTRLLQDIENRRGELKHNQPAWGMQDSRNWVRQQCLFIPGLVAVVAGCGTTVEAADICDVVQRRLRSFINDLMKVIDLCNAHLKDMSKSRLRLRNLAMALATLEIPGRPELRHDVYEVLREPLLSTFDETCKLLADHVVLKHAGELVSLKQTIATQPVRKTIVDLEAFHANWRDRVGFISTAYSFFGKDDELTWYRRRARDTALRLLSQTLSTVASLVQTHCPEEAHAVVSRTALGHALRDIEKD